MPSLGILRHPSELKLYATSLYGSRKYRSIFENIESYCMFVGYPRTGHSLIGSLLDAHENIVVAHEMNALRFLKAGFNQRQIFTLILENSRSAARHGRQQTGYSYDVPGQWQGRFKDLRVIGDKKGGGTTMMLRDSPYLLDKLQSELDVDVRIIHVTRNPYDVISTMAKRSGLPLENRAGAFFRMCETVSEIKKRIDERTMLDLRYESFLADPAFWLSETCHFLGVSAEDQDGYLETCKNLVFKSPHKSRLEAEWNRSLEDSIARKIQQFSFLHGYSFAD
jgi:hypothetical protein